MAQTDAERAKAYRSRQAKLRDTLRERGLTHIRVITSENQRGTIDKLCEVAVALQLGEDMPVPDDSLSEFNEAMVASFLASGTPEMVTFTDGVSTVAVKLLTFGLCPVLVSMCVAGPEPDMDEFQKKFKLLHRARRLTGYGWDTPAFLVLCEELGLDSSKAKPQFDPQFSALACDLVEWLNKKMLDGSVHINNVAIFTLVTDIASALQVNVSSTVQLSYLPDRIGENMEGLIAQNVPRVKELRSACERVIRANPHRSEPMVYTYIEFLPSSYGPGYKASLYGWVGEHDEDGWQTQYSDLHGIALLPSADQLKKRVWVRTCVQKLKRQGVVFLDRQQSENYLQGEGRYWLWWSGWRREATLTDRILWSMKKPPTPLDDRARLQAKAANLAGN